MEPPPRVVVNPELVAAAEELFTSGWIEKQAVRVKADFPNVDVVEAMGFAVEKLITRQEEVRNPKSYLATVAMNRARRLARRQAREQSLEALTNADASSFEPVDGTWSVEEQALLDAAYEEVRRHVGTWETDNVRVVTLLYLEAAHQGEPLTSAEAATLASEILGQEVSDDFARAWKSRGYKRLREYLEQLEQDGSEREGESET